MFHKCTSRNDTQQSVEIHDIRLRRFNEESKVRIKFEGLFINTYLQLSTS